MGMHREQLIAAGFTPVHYTGQDGEFLALTVPAELMPEVTDEVVSCVTEYEGMEVITEVCPNGVVQRYIPDLDLAWQFEVDTEEAHQLLESAINAGARLKARETTLSANEV